MDDNEIKIERIRPLTMDERALLLAEFAGLGAAYEVREMTREEFEALYRANPE